MEHHQNTAAVRMGKSRNQKRRHPMGLHRMDLHYQMSQHLKGHLYLMSPPRMTHRYHKKRSLQSLRMAGNLSGTPMHKPSISTTASHRPHNGTTLVYLKHPQASWRHLPV